jgi:hypothetical protein
VRLEGLGQLEKFNDIKNRTRNLPACSRVRRDSSVGITRGFELEGPQGRSSSPDRVKNFPFSMTSRPALEPPIQWIQDRFPRGVNWSRRDDDSPPSSTEIKKTWVYISTPPYAFVV